MASGHPIDSFAFMYRPESSQNSKSKVRPSSSMNPVYSPVQPGTAYANQKTMTYPGNNDGVMQPDTKWSYCYDSNVDYFPITSYPAGYPTTAPAYTPNIYQTGTPGYPQGYTTGTPYKVPPAQTNGAPPPYSASPNPYSTAMYPIRSAYPQQNLYAQGAYYSQPVFAQPHVIHHTTVVQPNSLPSTIYPAPVPSARPNSVPVGMLSGSTMAMSAGPLLTTPQHTQHIGTHPVTVPTYRPQGYSYVPPHW
ncbi:protein FAM168A isoform X2 [Ictalurus punctatus]|uniref:Protein FAM168A n=1 Tax=Ictalurus punctatus TaxID=7998 RepID=W5UJB2_ICTPU|nr:protein FAM168A isoform X2 [Ictalurus punctatus]XP_053501300.1 protein FAM168A-like isoform X2 [Ictalurus furcatus]